MVHIDSDIHLKHVERRRRRRTPIHRNADTDWQCAFCSAYQYLSVVMVTPSSAIIGACMNCHTGDYSIV